MESAQNLKRRMKSVQNIGQITKAMELVEATKMRRSQELALHSRPYAYAALELLGTLSAMKDVEMPELLRERPVARTAFLLMTSDRGLAGSFNSAVFRAFEHFTKEQGIDPADTSKYSFIAVGQKAKAYCERRKFDLAASFVRTGDLTTFREAEPVADALIEGYLAHAFDKVTAFFTTFVTALRQDAIRRDFLPVSYASIKQSIEDTIPRAGRYAEYARSEAFLEAGKKDHLIEPSPEEVLAELAPALLKTRVYHAILEANASEHSARRVAMKNASDNAADLSDSLTITYNKSRQAAITNQIIEVTSGAQALE
jgi:F-type H+-transporting ATPase subunit gamma